MAARVRVWIEAVAQFEAFSSLSGYRYEHHEDPFPELVPAGDATRAPACSRECSSDIRCCLVPRWCATTSALPATLQLLVVSGSNMSGKSTLLRTVGINAVLALAGAPVRAASLRLSPLAIGATLRIQDSLQEGRSRFYAEITRIREARGHRGRSRAAALPARRALSRHQLARSAVRARPASCAACSIAAPSGLITTHDLALTSVADELSPRAANVHFEDWFEDGDIRFDYRMKPGPVTRSNALALMRAVGLDVPSESYRSG